MVAQIIDGVLLSAKFRKELGKRVTNLKSKGITPGLAVVLVGENAASGIYVRNKIKACNEQGIYSVLRQYESSIQESELIKEIAHLNVNSQIHGILVQLPLPSHLNAQKIIATISPDKDVDGLQESNMGALMKGAPLFKPCTPYACMKILEEISATEFSIIYGAHAVIVGASNIVGKPLALLLLQAGATVTVCNSKTRNLSLHTKMADILVVATGKAGLVTGSMVKPGSVVIDVGINRIALINSNNSSMLNKKQENLRVNSVDDVKNYKLCGDVDFDSASQVAGWITPVPGGVGPMTITMLLFNTIQAAERHIAN